MAVAPPTQAQTSERQAAGAASGDSRHQQRACGLESPPDVLRSDGLDQQLMLVKQDAVLPLVRPRA